MKSNSCIEKPSSRMSKLPLHTEVDIFLICTITSD